MTITALSDVAIRTAISDVLTGAIQGVRPIATSTLAADGVIGAPAQLTSQRAMVLPTFTIATEYGPHADQPQQPSVPWFYALTVTVELTSLLTSAVLGRVAYDAVKAANHATAALVHGALAWPGKVTTTAAAVETGIVSGVLRFEGATVVRDTPPPSDGTPGGGLFVTSHRFTGTVRIDRPVA
jgi:hypothetical protein